MILGVVLILGAAPCDVGGRLSLRQTDGGVDRPVGLTLTLRQRVGVQEAASAPCSGNENGFDCAFGRSLEHIDMTDAVGASLAEAITTDGGEYCFRFDAGSASVWPMTFERGFGTLDRHRSLTLMCQNVSTRTIDLDGGLVASTVWISTSFPGLALPNPTGELSTHVCTDHGWLRPTVVATSPGLLPAIQPRHSNTLTLRPKRPFVATLNDPRASLLVYGWTDFSGVNLVETPTGISVPLDGGQGVVDDLYPDHAYHVIAFTPNAIAEATAAPGRHLSLAPKAAVKLDIKVHDDFGKPLAQARVYLAKRVPQVSCAAAGCPGENLEKELVLPSTLTRGHLTAVAPSGAWVVIEVPSLGTEPLFSSRGFALRTSPGPQHMDILLQETPRPEL